jgi:hypothetical protein
VDPTADLNDLEKRKFLLLPGLELPLLVASRYTDYAVPAYSSIAVPLCIRYKPIKSKRLKKVIIKYYVHFSVCVKYGAVRDKYDEKELKAFFIGRKIVNKLQQFTFS